MKGFSTEEACVGACARGKVWEISPLVVLVVARRRRLSSLGGEGGRSLARARVRACVSPFRSFCLFAARKALEAGRTSVVFFWGRAEEEDGGKG